MSFLNDHIHGHTTYWLSEKLNIPRAATELVVDDLKNRSLLRQEEGIIQGMELSYFLTRSGVDEVQSWDDRSYEAISASVIVVENGGTEKVPASDRSVTLHHNQPDYQDAVAALDKVIEEFRNDHRLDNEDKERKDAISKFLEGGRRLLDGKEITAEESEIWLVKPLKWIVGKFTEGTLQAAAAKALEFICKLVGLGN